MVEIAISLAIIGFALVAIIGVLPIGMNVQRENREETIINQDASVWFDAIRGGARGLDDLTNYVDAITNVVTAFNPDGSIVPGFPHTYGYHRTNWTFNVALQPPIDQGLGHEITNGYRIIGLLSTPKYIYWDVANHVVATNNNVVAYVRAMSGLAAEKFPQTNAEVRELAFNYRMLSEVVPYAGWDTNWVQFNAPGLATDEVAARSNYWMVARNLNANLRDVRLSFRWPILPSGKIGNGRQTFRTMVGGQLLQTNDTGQTLYFFQPQTFVKAL